MRQSRRSPLFQDNLRNMNHSLVPRKQRTGLKNQHLIPDRVLAIAPLSIFLPGANNQPIIKRIRYWLFPLLLTALISNARDRLLKLKHQLNYGSVHLPYIYLAIIISMRNHRRRKQEEIEKEHDIHDAPPELRRMTRERKPTVNIPASRPCCLPKRQRSLLRKQKAVRILEVKFLKLEVHQQKSDSYRSTVKVLHR